MGGCVDGRVVDIRSLSSDARRLLPQMPISDAIFTERSASRLQAWRTQDCGPAARRFHNDVADPPQLQTTPRRRPVEEPIRPTLLEVTVYPDALESTPPYHQPGLLVRTVQLHSTCMTRWEALPPLPLKLGMHQPQVIIEQSIQRS